MTIAARKPFGWTASFVGFGPEYATPANIPGEPSALGFNSSGTALLEANSSVLYSWPWSSAGAGARYTNTRNPGGGIDTIAAPKNDNNYIAVSTRSANRLMLFPWSDATGLGTAYSNPGTLPSATTFSTIFHPTQQVIFCAFQALPGIRAYRYGSSGWVSAYTPPSPGTFGTTVSVHPNGDAVVVAGGATGAFVYPWTYAGGFGTAYAQPLTTVPGSIIGTAFSPDGQAIIFGTTTAPYIHAYAWDSSTGFGAKFADPPAGGIASAAYRLYFSPDGKALIAVTNNIGATIGLYKWSASGFGSTLYTNTANITGVSKIAFNPAGDTIAVGFGVSPFLRIYQWQS
jgi:hypothetical protein